VNPFRIIIVIAVVIAVIAFAGFIAVHFFGLVWRPESLGSITAAIKAL
jgi:hypothetical protein